MWGRGHAGTLAALQDVEESLPFALLGSDSDNGGVEGSIVVQEVKKRKGNDGYNVATGDYEDLVKAGVVDPNKVTRSALQNAASIAGLLLTTECLITEIPEKEKAAPAPGGHGGGMGGMDY
jgi:chaperonin GroEL